MKLLVVEDEARVASFLDKGLRANGYDVEWARSGQEALHLAARLDISLVILDLGLPDMDGLDVLGSLRAGGSPVPVLVLSARGSMHDRCAGSTLAQTTTWASRSHSRSSWLGCAPTCDPGPMRGLACCGPAASAWICCAAR